MYIDVACCRGPPAAPLQGNIPSQRPRSELQANPVPPACIQNAMMTKDKKPFTYTPGGIDLSEIRSPRMAKRIERNAQAQGVGEVPRSPNTYYPSGPLPPSALAAMQTNMPVQVFPSGATLPPPPAPPLNQQQQQASSGSRGIPPPPPPPPPPPQGPLPTKPVSTNEGVFDRPDMTRIIPENPMAMLRKTPKVEQKTFLDELNDMDRQNIRQGPPLRQNNVASPPYQQYIPQAPHVQQYTPPAQQYQVQTPPVIAHVNNSLPGGSNLQQNNQRCQVGALYIPPVTAQTTNGNSSSYEVTSPPTPPIRSPQSPQSPQVQLNKSPRPWQNQKREEEKPTWAHKSERVSPPQELYIAPPYQPSQEVQRQPQPEPPIRQQSYQQQPEHYSPQYQNQPAQLLTYTSNQGQNPNMVLKEPPHPAEGAGMEVVWVTQPQVMVHPGVPQQQQQQQRSPQAQVQQKNWTPPTPTKQQQADGQGGRIIPIQVEREQPPTPERNFNRQQSWGPGPTQSNSFKKLTSTDGDYEEDEGPTTEHGPMTSQEFNQTPADQIRKMKLSSQDDRELVHKFKQDPMIEYFYYEEDPRYTGGYIPSRVFCILDESDDDTYLHQEVDPRYRGPAIPSKAFRLLQAMTDNYPDSNVPRGQPQQSTPHIRNIPIQIEGDDSSGPYVHPSQQTIQEPKKYTGGNIPGRSFKMLQSMTGQTSPLATHNENFETNHPYNPYTMYPPPSPYLPYPPYDPYWSNYYYTQSKIKSKQAENKSGNKVREGKPSSSRSTTQSMCSSCRNTPVPFWNYYYPYSYYPAEETEEEIENSELQQYQQMWDPYYYPYYYYYPPVQTPPLPKDLKRRSYADFEELSSVKDNKNVPKHLKRRSYTDAGSSESNNDVPKILKRRSYADSEDWSSSNDEIAYYTQQAKGVQQEILAGRVLQAKTPGITSPSVETDCEDIQEDEKQMFKIEDILEAEDEDSSDSEEDNILSKSSRNEGSGSLPSVKSVKDMKILIDIEEDKITDVLTLIDEDNNVCEATQPNSDEYEVEETSTTENTEEPSLHEGDDTMPHLLSVIFEESDFSNRTSRASSVLTNASNDTIVLEDENDISEALSVKLPLKLTFTVNCDNEDVTEITVGPHEIATAALDKENVDTEVSFALCANETDNKEIEESKPIIDHRKSSSDSSEIDFWSEIITDEEVVPKRNRLEEYKNAIKDVELVTNKTIEKSDVGSAVCVNQYRKSSFEIENANENETSSLVVHISNLETGVSSFEFNKTTANEDNSSNKLQRRIDKGNPICETLKKTSPIEETDDTIIVVNVEDYKLSNLIFERQEDRQVLAVPKLDLDSSVDEFCNKRIIPKVSDIKEIALEEKRCDIQNEVLDEYYESSSDFEDEELIEKLCANSQEFNNVDYINDIEDSSSSKVPNNIQPLDSEESVNQNIEISNSNKTDADTTDSDEEVKTNDTLDTIKEAPELLCSTNSSNSGSLSRSSSTSGKEHNKEYSECEESEEDESGLEEDDHETPVIEIEQQEERTTPNNDQNNNEEAVFEVPTIKDRIKSLQEASCKPIKKIIATIEVPKGANKLPNIIQSTQNKSIDNSEDEGDSGVTSDMSRHISDSESEFSELRKLSRYQRAATHSRLYQLLHSSCSEEELQQEEAEGMKKYEENTNSMMKRREHLSLTLKKTIESESSSGLNSPSSPLTDKLACELVLSLLRKKKCQIFRNMPMEHLHAAALKILQEDKDCTDLSSSEEFHNCLSPLRTDTEYSTPAHTPAEFYTNSTYTDYYATWNSFDPDTKNKPKSVNSSTTPKCPRVPLAPKQVSKVPPDHVPACPDQSDL